MNTAVLEVKEYSRIVIFVLCRKIPVLGRMTDRPAALGVILFLLLNVVQFPDCRKKTNKNYYQQQVRFPSVTAWVSSLEMTWSYREGGVALTCLSGCGAGGMCQGGLPLWSLFVLEVAVHV